MTHGSEMIPKWQASIQYLYPGEATSGRMAVYLAADVHAAIAAAEQRVLLESADWKENDSNYAAGIKAARDTVEALTFDPLNRDQGPNETKRQALAAIDALKGTHVRRPDEVT